METFFFMEMRRQEITTVDKDLTSNKLLLPPTITTEIHTHTHPKQNRTRTKRGVLAWGWQPSSAFDETKEKHFWHAKSTTPWATRTSPFLLVYFFSSFLLATLRLQKYLDKIWARETRTTDRRFSCQNHQTQFLMEPFRSWCSCAYECPHIIHAPDNHPFYWLSHSTDIHLSWIWCRAVTIKVSPVV